MKKDNGQLRTEKQAVIFEAALKVFRQKGFHKARIADIATEAGISYGLVYHYYHNKEGLFNTILNQWWEDLYQLLIETRKGGRIFTGSFAKSSSIFWIPIKTSPI